jgi:hypothetical protein
LRPWLPPAVLCMPPGARTVRYMLQPTQRSNAAAAAAVAVSLCSVCCTVGESLATVANARRGAYAARHMLSFCWCNHPTTTTQTHCCCCCCCPYGTALQGSPLRPWLPPGVRCMLHGAPTTRHTPPCLLPQTHQTLLLLLLPLLWSVPLYRGVPCDCCGRPRCCVCCMAHVLRGTRRPVCW